MQLMHKSIIADNYAIDNYACSHAGTYLWKRTGFVWRCGGPSTQSVRHA